MSQELSPEAKQIVEYRGLGELAETMGIKILELTGESGYATMPVEGNRQPLGLVHGGAYVVLGETLGSMCATLAAGVGRHAVGIEINASHSGSAKDGLLHARATLASLGRTLATHNVEITDDNGKRLSTIRITNYLRDNR